MPHPLARYSPRRIACCVKRLPKTTLSKAVSMLGFPVAFLGKNHGKFQGPGDMGGTAAFGIYKIQKNGTYARVG